MVSELYVNIYRLILKIFNFFKKENEAYETRNYMKKQTVPKLRSFYRQNGTKLRSLSLAESDIYSENEHRTNRLLCKNALLNHTLNHCKFTQFMLYHLIYVPSYHFKQHLIRGNIERDI